MKYILFFLIALISGSITTAVAQNKVVVIPLGDELIPIIQQEITPIGSSQYLEDAIDKPVIWNKGWDTNIGYKTKIDPTVQIELIALRPVFGHPGIVFTSNEIKHWGEQTYYNGSSSPIYAKAVLLVDKGNAVEGGPFEWCLNKQGSISFNNILKTNSQTLWVKAWTDPKPGDKVWFLIMSDDEKFSSNPISFIWP